MSHRSRSRVSRGDRISASEQNEFIEAIRSQRLIPVAPIHGGGGKPLILNRYQPFWAKLLSGTNPYAWQEVYWNGSAWTVPTGARSGTTIDHPAYEVTNVNNLAANTIVLLLEGFQGKDYRFAHLRYGTGGDNPCPSNEATLCVIAWDIKGYCDFVSGSGHKYDPAVDGFPSFLYSGATVTIKEVDFTVIPNVITTYDTGTTDTHGSYCKTIPPKITDPSVTPTINPVGGGASGGSLTQGTYTAQYTYTNQYGETKASSASASFQVGVPSPLQAPTTADPTVNATGGGATGGSLQADTYYLRYTFTDGTGETPSSHDSAAFTVAAGNKPRATLPGLGSRTNATGMSIYLAADDGFGDPGPYARYATGVTGTTYDLTAAWVNTNPAPPISNTTAKNIPRMSVAGSVGTEKGNIYLNGGKYHAFTALPVDLIWAFTGPSPPPPTGNTTAPKGFKVEVSGVGDCPALTSAPFWVSTPCSTVTVGFGFCCWKNCFSASDFDTTGSLGPSLSCSTPRAATPLTPGPGGGCTNIVDLTPWASKPSDNTYYGPAACPSLVDNFSTVSDDPVNWLGCVLSQSGYWDRCVYAPAPCSVPAIVTSKSFTMKSKTAYLRNLCCGTCTRTPPGVELTPEIIPRLLYATFNGPVEIFGGYNGVSIPLNWLGGSLSDDGDTTANFDNCKSGALSGDLCRIVWDSGCLPPSGRQWHWWKNGFCGGLSDPMIYPAVDVPFSSARAQVIQFYTGGSLSGLSCKTLISFTNYYNGDCTDSPPPTPPGSPPGLFMIPGAGEPYCAKVCPTPIPSGVTPYLFNFFKSVGLFNIGTLGADGLSSWICGPVNLSGGNDQTVSGSCSGYGGKPAWSFDLTE